jgi:hypothetical protein
MFTLDPVIDTIQTGKKTFVQTFVSNENVAKALNTFIDAQTDYTKKAMKIGSDTATVLAQESVKAVEGAVKFDYAKFGEGIMKAYQSTTK